MSASDLVAAEAGDRAADARRTRELSAAQVRLEHAIHDSRSFGRLRDRIAEPLLVEAAAYAIEPGHVRVLHAEDDPAIPLLVVAALGGIAEVELCVATSLKATLQALAVASFDCVLLDLNLGDSRGTSTLRRVRAASPLTPIVVLSGCAEAIEPEVEALGVRFCRKGLLSPAAILCAVARAVLERSIRR